MGVYDLHINLLEGIMWDLFATTVVDSVLSLKYHFMGHSTKWVPFVFVTHV